jgi:predicted nucleotidyltransferase
MTDELTETLREIVTRLESQGIAYMLVGSMAALAHGRDRATKDLDMVLEANAPLLRALVRSLPEERFYASEEAALEALRYESQFNVLDMDTGWKVDFMMRKRRPFSETEFGRRFRVEVMGVSTYVASVEDVIVAKLEWAKAGGSERQLEDVRELVKLRGAKLDREYVEQWVQGLDLRDVWVRALDA